MEVNHVPWLFTCKYHVMEIPCYAGSSVSVCPWASLKERNIVLAKLYSDDLDDQADAFRHIDIWRTRCRPRVPLGIEVTLIVGKTLWLHNHYKQNQSEVKYLDDDYFQQMYSISIIRFINLVTECGQVMNFPIPIHSIAHKMGIPEWIVDLRHSSTHSTMPSLEILEIALKWAYNWLKLTYWENEIDVSTPYILFKPAEIKSDTLLESVLQFRQNLNKLNEEEKTEDLILRKKALFRKFRCLIKQTDCNVFVSTVLSDGLLFPSTQDVMRSSKKVWMSPQMLRRHMCKWLPVIKMLKVPEKMKILIKELFIIAAGEGPKVIIASNWIRFILVWLKRKRSIRYRDESKFCLEILEIVSPSSVPHMQLVFDVFGTTVPNEKVEKLLKLSKRVVSSTTERYWCRNKRSTLANLRLHTEDVTPDFSTWDKCPLGVIPSQIGCEMLDLSLPDHVDQIHIATSVNTSSERVYGFEKRTRKSNAEQDSELTEVELNAINLL